MRARTVAIVGGGVGGLSAAHELAERGYTVDVYEARGTAGGKARTQYLVDTGRGGRRDLPGEHGFRFFPAFYRHVVDTMARIPYGDGSVADNLRPATEAGVALGDGRPVARMPRCKPGSPRDWIDGFTLSFRRLGFTAADVLLFLRRVLRYYTSCEERRLAQYESISWWDYLRGDDYSPSFQRLLTAVPRTMVAMDPRRGSARTVGDASMQLLADHGSDGARTDRLLCGPTSEKWIEPWRRHLETMGVRFHLGCAAVAIHAREGRVASVELADGTRAQADQFVLALPIEALRPLIGDELAALDPGLDRLHRLPRARFDRLTSWMSGIQFYLRRDVPILRGHLLVPESPWALTCVSQPQFWSDDGPLGERYGDGSVEGLLSVDISDFETRGTYIRKRARDCSAAEIASEVWQQLRAAINTGSHILLRDADLVTWHLDDDLVPREHGGMISRTPLLVHPPGSWHDRPEAVTEVPNLTLAADHVRTHTNIASMEGANESARRAVNAILDRTESAAARCEVWPLREPRMFERAKQIDRRMMRGGAEARHIFDLVPGGAGALGSLLESLQPARA
jgi:15-cis-phytoene desaturase